MIEIETAPALDLSALVERLRLAGFRIDTRQYLTAHELLLALAATGVQLDDDPDRLVSHLGPIFCTSVHEQDLFADEVRHWFGRETASGERSWAGEAKRGTSDSAPPFWRGWRLGVAAATVIVALLIGWRWYYVENVALVDVQGSVVLEQPDGRLEPHQATVVWEGSRVPVDERGRFVLSATRSQLRTGLSRLSIDDASLPSASFETRLGTNTLQVVIRFRPLPGLPQLATPTRRVQVALPATRTETHVTPWTAVALGALAFTGLAWGLSWLIDRARRILALRRLPVEGEPELVTLRVPETQALPVSEAQLRRAAIALRRRRDESLIEIDVSSTIDATARAAGFFVPRYSSRRATPEYLALVSRRGENDHQARAFDAILDHLAELGVVLDRYSFHDDPRFIHSDVTARGYRLAEVVSRHHRATLLVCAESAAGSNHRAGQVASWVEATRPLVRRIYLTPEAPYRWTRLEFELIEAGFIVLPATDQGWTALADLIMGGRLESFGTAPYARAFPAVLGTNEVRWLDRNEPPPEIVQKLIRQLKGFLGPDGFAWLCACAVYPEITWPLTLRMAHEPPDYSILPALARLPWFRHGFMPDWLRHALVDLVPPVDERRLRGTLERLLEELADQATDGAHSHHSKLRIARWVGPRALLSAAAAGSPLRDHVFVGFMFGARPDRLWLRAPEFLARVFRRRIGRFVPPRHDLSAPERSFRERLTARFRWWLVFRPRLLRLVLSCAIGLMAIAVLPVVMSQAQVTTEQESISFVEVPSGEFIMGSDRKTDVAAASNEQPQHLLFVPTFFIATTPVTVAQYNVCVNEGGCRPGDRRALDGPVDWPVRYVSWNEAIEYCRWLEDGLKTWKGTPDLIAGVLSGRLGERSWHVTLPSEPEWEKAARGSDGRIYPWGNSQQTVAATRQQAWPAGTPFPVGRNQSEASPYGVLDMSGNVGEWTRSLDRPYPYLSVDGRESLDSAPGGQDTRVVRSGGSDASRRADGEVRAAQRGTSSQTRRDALIGFRVAISPLDPVNPSPPDQQLAGAKTPPPIAPTPKKAEPPRKGTASSTSTQQTTQSTLPVGPSAGPKATAPQNPAGAKTPAAQTSAATQSKPDYASVLAVLQRLEAAYARLDVNEVARIWPSRAGQFRSQRAALNGMRLDVVQSEITINGDTAIVRCELRWKYDWKRANQAGESSTANAELTLRRTPDGSWVIVRP
jgi:formylglycine-generating enzyme required for sulfatase activity